MPLEDLYRASRDNFRFSRYSGVSQQLTDHSRFNIDRIPSRYNTAGKIAGLPDTSKFNIDITPRKYHG
jgi:hypothetical protein